MTETSGYVGVAMVAAIPAALALALVGTVLGKAGIAWKLGRRA